MAGKIVKKREKIGHPSSATKKILNFFTGDNVIFFGWKRQMIRMALIRFSSNSENAKRGSGHFLKNTMMAKMGEICGHILVRMRQH